MKAIILAAGRGTRFGEITRKTPKSLILVAGKPIIEYVLKALPTSVKEVYLVVGHLGNKIKKHIGKKHRGLKIKYIKLKKLTGTATAVWHVKKHLGKEKFLVLYGDNLYSKKELAKLVRFQWAFGLAKSIPPTNKHLNFLLNSQKEIVSTRYPTKKEMKKGILISTGAFVFDSRIFKYKLVRLSNGEYGLPQTILKATKTMPIKGVVMKKWIQINRPEDIKRAKKMLK